METGYIVLLAPCCCVASPLFSALGREEFPALLFKTARDAGSLGTLIIAFALLREPIGFMNLSLPGGVQGIIELFPGFDGDSFLPIKIIAGSAGAFLLLGYGTALFRGVKKPEA
jgi:hypothetical protein